MVYPAFVCVIGFFGNGNGVSGIFLCSWFLGQKMKKLVRAKNKLKQFHIPGIGDPRDRGSRGDQGIGDPGDRGSRRSGIPGIGDPGDRVSRGSGIPGIRCPGNRGSRGSGILGIRDPRDRGSRGSGTPGIRDPENRGSRGSGSGIKQKTISNLETRDGQIRQTRRRGQVQCRCANANCCQCRLYADEKNQ